MKKPRITEMLKNMSILGATLFPVKIPSCSETRRTSSPPTQQIDFPAAQHFNSGFWFSCWLWCWGENNSTKKYTRMLARDSDDCHIKRFQVDFLGTSNDIKWCPVNSALFSNVVNRADAKYRCRPFNRLWFKPQGKTKKWWTQQDRTMMLSRLSYNEDHKMKANWSNRVKALPNSRVWFDRKLSSYFRCRVLKNHGMKNVHFKHFPNVFNLLLDIRQAA